VSKGRILKEQAIGYVLLEQEGNGSPVAKVTLIKAGLSLNNVNYPPDVLAAAAHLYNDKPCMLDHSWSPSVRDIAGWFRNARWNAQDQAIEADLYLLDTQAGRVLLELAREEQRLRAEGNIGEGSRLFGLSHQVFGDVEVVTDEGGNEYVNVREITEVMSVDAVAFPAANGEVKELHESADNPEKTCMSAEQFGRVLEEAMKRATEGGDRLAERATRFRDLPLAERARPWNGAAARQRLRKWASEDGSGNTDTIDWRKYRWGFFWYDHTDPERLGSYKLPFADVLGGTIRAIPRGIFAAAGVVSGARGGPDIPEEDMAGVKRHISAYYRKMRDEWDDPNLMPPWEREESRPTDEEAAAFIEAFGLDAFVETFGYSPSTSGGEAIEEQHDESKEEEAMSEANKNPEAKTPETAPMPDEKGIREQVAEEFAEKLRGLVEENKQLQEEVEALKEQIKAFEEEKAAAERAAKLEEMFLAAGIEGAAREVLEGVVSDLPLEKAEKVIKLAAGTEPKEADPAPKKRVQEGTEEASPTDLGRKYAEQVFGLKVEEAN